MQLSLFLLLAQGARLSQWQTCAFVLYLKEFVPENSMQRLPYLLYPIIFYSFEKQTDGDFTTIECTEDEILFFFIWMSLSPFSHRGMSLLRSAD